MKQPLLLLGVGGAGAGICRAVNRAFGPGVRTLVVDTDATAGDGFAEESFVLVGGKRLAGRGSGRQAANARSAFADDPSAIDSRLDGVRVAVVVAALAGGTGGGITGEILKRLRRRGISSLLFAALPFGFEGEDAMQAARSATGPVTQYADASVIVPLDRLAEVTGSDVAGEALARAADSLGTAITLFWRVLAKPGYIRFDVEGLRAMLSHSGPSVFAGASAAGEDRAAAVVRALKASPLLKRDGVAPIRRILLGVLAGDDLRLSEIATLSDAVRGAYGGEESHFNLGVVNDEDVFSGRLTAVVFLSEENARHGGETSGDRPRAGGRLAGIRNALGAVSRFSGTERTFWGEEDLDVPTYVRRSLTLEH